MPFGKFVPSMLGCKTFHKKWEQKVNYKWDSLTLFTCFKCVFQHRDSAIGRLKQNTNISTPFVWSFELILAWYDSMYNEDRYVDKNDLKWGQVCWQEGNGADIHGCQHRRRFPEGILLLDGWEWFYCGVWLTSTIHNTYMLEKLQQV